MNFKEFDLSSLIKLKYGKNQKKVEDKNGKFPIFGTGGLMGYATDFLYDKPSVLIPRKGSISNVYYQQTPFWTVDTLFYTEINENLIIPKYLYYYISRIDLNKYNEGTTIPSLRSDTLNHLKINVPPILYQKQVLKLLSNIDNILKNNNQLNQNLEKLCVAQFKQNFLLRKPFEDELMKDSSLGEIPKSWNVVSIVDFVDEMKNGGTPRRGNEEYWVDGDIPWLKTKEVDNSIIVNSEEFITKKGLKNSSAKLLPINTVIMALYGKGTAGRVGLLKFEATTNQACCAMICNNPNKAIYLYLYLLINQKKIESFANGSVQQNLSKDILENFEIIVPPDNIINNANFNLIFNKIKNNIKENQNLTQIRDTLLPKLMSGEIDVSKIEVE